MDAPRNRLAALIRELTAQLRLQEGEIRKLTVAMQDRRRLFIAGTGAELGAGTAELEEIAERCFALERERLRVMREISTYVGLPLPALTSSRLRHVVHGGEGSGLAEQARRTRLAAEALKVETKVGESLLDESARWHEGLMQELARTTTDAPTYARSGQRSAGHGNGFVNALL